jgi:hypothetical protein
MLVDTDSFTPPPQTVEGGAPYKVTALSMVLLKFEKTKSA